jgi:hypothetical protein
MDDDMGRGIPKYALGGIDSNTLLFLQLVEHLILRALRLYHAWTQVDIHILRHESMRLHGGTEA